MEWSVNITCTEGHLIRAPLAKRQGAKGLLITPEGSSEETLAQVMVPDECPTCLELRELRTRPSKFQLWKEKRHFRKHADTFQWEETDEHDELS